MTTRHTPGPWTEHDGFIVGKFNDEKVHYVCDPRCAPAEKYLLGEMDANAKLIAAAPDLLAALIECERRLRFGYSENFTEQECERMCPQLKLTRAAIAKATK
jgi:hypothetical protein